MFAYIFFFNIILLVSDAAELKENRKSSGNEKSVQNDNTDREPVDEMVDKSGFYCGWHLQAMGYENTSPNFLYFIYRDSEDQASFFRDCSVDGCVGSSKAAYCPCRIGKRYCGYEITLHGLVVALADDHNVYRCRARSTISVVEKCSHRCWADEADDSECVFGLLEECEDGRHYCGLELMASMKLDRWTPHYLYECVDNGTRFRSGGSCDGGCIPSTIAGEEAYCDTTRVAYLPSARDHKKDEL